MPCFACSYISSIMWLFSLPMSVFSDGTMQTVFLVWPLFKHNILLDILNCFVCFHSSQVQEFWLLVSGCVSMKELKDSLLQQIPHLCSSQVRFGHSPARFLSSVSSQWIRNPPLSPNTFVHAPFITYKMRSL